MAGISVGGEGGYSPEQSEGGLEPGLTPEQEEHFRQLVAEVEGLPSPEEAPPVDVDFKQLSQERQEKIVALEGEYNDRRLAIKEGSAKKKLEWLGNVFERTAKFLDLDTKEKVATALLEVVPYVGLVYALCGKRLVIDKDDAGKHRVSLDDLSMVDRVIYLAGEVLVSGHALRGALNTIRREGLKKVLVPAAREVGKNAGQLLVKRARQGAEREFGGLLPDIGETGGTEDEK